MNIHKTLFFCLLIIFTTTNTPVKAQIIEAGLYKAYLDGIYVSSMVMNDSIAYVSSWYGVARLNMLTKEFHYLHELNSAMPPIYFWYRGATVDQEGKLWTILDNQLVNIDANGTITYVGPEPKYPATVLKTDHNNQIHSFPTRRSSDHRKSVV